ncbi:MAG: copper chaperone PCu(A)C [Anaerolineales bacterium]
MTSRPQILSILIFSLTFLHGCAGQPDLALLEAWARPGDPGANSAVYLVIENRGGADQLVAVESDASAEVQLHRSILHDDGVVEMQRQQMIEIPARGRLVLEPGGYHIMLLDLQRSLEEGQAIRIQLIFKHEDPIDAQAQIRNP